MSPAAGPSTTHRRGGIEDAADALWEAPSVVCATHERSDGDALSAIALALACRTMGKEAAALHDFPPTYDWLLQSSGPWLSVPSVAPGAFVVTLDTAHYARIAWPKEVGERVQGLVAAHGSEALVPLSAYDDIVPVALVIDHHVTNRAYGLLNWIEPERSAVAEMVCDLLLELERRAGCRLVDGDVARLLFVGLVTSTAWFQQDTGDHTWETALLLDRRGRFDKAALAAGLDHMSLAHYRLTGELRQAVRVDDRVAHAYIDRATLERYGVTSVEAAAFVDDLEKVGADITLLFVEMEAGGVRVRLRSPRFPMHTLAQQFGGGGHERASGTVVAGRDEADGLVMAAREMVRVGPGA